MKIVHICTFLEGGAGLCARRIVKATLAQGIDAYVLVAHGDKSDNVDVIRPFCNWSNIWLIRKIQKILNLLGFWPKSEVIRRRIVKESYENVGYFSSPVTNYKNIVNHPWIKDADIVHLHWIGNFVDYESFFSSINNKPIIWTIHDENPGLGGFHLTSWKDASTESFRRLDEELLEIKQKAYNHIKNMTLVAISDKMSRYFQNNPLLAKFPSTKIHNGVEGDSFVILDKQKCRDVLGIPSHHTVFIFVSHNIHDDNKGLNKLIQALGNLRFSSITLICLGNYKKIPSAPFNIRCDGFVGNNRLLSIYYSASDFLVMPSYHESFGQTLLEAMACGVPVVAYPCGIAEELINDNNGVICENFTVDALSLGIKESMLKSYDRTVIREDVLSQYSYDIIAKQYIALYKKVLKREVKHIIPK